MAHAKASGRLVREMTMALNGDQLIRSPGLGRLDVCVKLVQSLAADPASTAVFEEKNGSLTGFSNRRVQLVYVQEVL